MIHQRMLPKVRRAPQFDKGAAAEVARLKGEEAGASTEVYTLGASIVAVLYRTGPESVEIAVHGRRRLPTLEEIEEIRFVLTPSDYGAAVSVRHAPGRETNDRAVTIHAAKRPEGEGRAG